MRPPTRWRAGGLPTSSPRRRPAAPLALAIVVLAPAFAACLAVPEEVPAALSLDPPALREFDLYVRDGVMEPRPGVRLFALGFVADPEAPLTVPGPEIRVREGDTVRVRLHDGHHTIHWHGVRLPWEMDGVPGMTQALGDGVYTYEFVAKDPGTYWYHCHVDAPSHVDFGMFGAFIVEPRDPAADPPFDREATLILHEQDSRSSDLLDASVAAALGFAGGNAAPPGYVHQLPEYAARNVDGVLQVGPFMVEAVTGADVAGDFAYMPRYDTFMINGKSYPDTEPVTIATGETLRLRLINAGQSPHTLHLHGHKALVTHRDGSLLASPYLADTIGLFPGERYDVYVEADNPGRWDLHDHGASTNAGAYAANDGVFPGGMNTMFVYEDWIDRPLPAPTPTRAPAAEADAATKRAAPNHGHASGQGHAAPAANPPAAAPTAGAPHVPLVDRIAEALPETPLSGILALLARLS